MTSARSIFLAVLALGLAATPALAQEPPALDEAFRGEASVTAVEVVVDLPPRRRPFAPDELTATSAEGPLAVVGVDPAGEALDRLVLYIDLALSDRYQVAWAAGQLADHLDELVARGPVELVVADPEPRTVVSPTRDTAALAEALGRLVFFSEPDDTLIELRLDAAEDALPAAGADGRWQAETDLVQDRLDTFVLALVERSRTAGLPRAVFLATGGFDLVPGGVEVASEAGATSLDDAVAAAGRTLAAYGWRVVPLLAPAPEGMRPGFRIGRWRFVRHLGRRPATRVVKADYILWLIPVFGGTFEEDRDPERAEAHLSIARSRLAGGEMAQAAEAAETAIHHFAGDPRTAELEVEALLLAAEAYESIGKRQRARSAVRRAVRIDPVALADHPVTAALPRDPEAALAALAAPSGGFPGRHEHAVTEALAGMESRAVVSVQLPGPPDGELHRLTIGVRDAETGEHSSTWARYGSPIQVTAARIRRLLAGYPEGEAPLAAALTRSGVLTLHFDASLVADAPEPTLRATAGLVRESGEIEIVPLGIFEAGADPDDQIPATSELEIPFPPLDRDTWGVVLLENLLTGAWGAAPLGVE